jgi:hypothetical protein
MEGNEIEGGDTAQLVEALQFLGQEVDTLKTRLQGLEDYFHNEFIGGLMKMVDSQDDDLGAEDLRTNYGDLLGPYEGIHSRLHPMMGGSADEDLWHAVFREVKKISDPEERKAAVQKIAEAMAAAKNSLAGLVGPGAASVEKVSIMPAEGAPGHETAEGPAKEGAEEGAEDDPLALLAANVAKLKKGKGKEVSSISA